VVVGAGEPEAPDGGAAGFVGDPVALGVADGVDVGVAVGVAEGAGDGVALGVAEGAGDGVAVGVTVGAADGDGAADEAEGEGLGAGVAPTGTMTATAEARTTRPEWTLAWALPVLAGKIDDVANPAPEEELASAAAAPAVIAARTVRTLRCALPG
jgi:hypothetical protein